MNAVYPLGTGSHWDNNEIRYSVESLKYAKGVSGVFVIGEDAGIGTHILMRETQAPAVNIWEKLITACVDERVSDPFLFINDDHFFLSEVDALNYPNYYCYNISQYPIQFANPHNPYYQLVKRTWDILGDVVFFNVHCPCIIHKAKFIECFETYRQQIYTGPGLLVKTTYLQGAPGQYMKDYKVRHNESYETIAKNSKGRHIISGGEFIHPDLQKFLKDKFQNVLTRF